MQHLPGKRVLALIFGLVAGAAGSAYAQDTTDTGRATMDTTAPGAGAIDTSGADTSGADTSAMRDTTGADTSATGDTTDTSGVQNPPGYRGMERDTTIFPPDTSSGQQDAGRVEGRTTGTYSDSAWQDTTGAAQNPPGYRGMERPSGMDTTEAGAAGDTTGQDTSDTTSVGDTEPRVEDEATPRLEPSEGGTGDTTGQSADSIQ